MRHPVLGGAKGIYPVVVIKDRVRSCGIEMGCAGSTGHDTGRKGEILTGATCVSPFG